MRSQQLLTSNGTQWRDCGRSYHHPQRTESAYRNKQQQQQQYQYSRQAAADDNNSAQTLSLDYQNSFNNISINGSTNNSNGGGDGQPANKRPLLPMNNNANNNNAYIQPISMGSPYNLNRGRSATALPTSADGTLRNNHNNNNNNNGLGGSPQNNNYTPGNNTGNHLRRSDLAGWRTRSLLPSRNGFELPNIFLPILKLRGLPYFCSKRHVLLWFGDLARHIVQLQFIAEVEPLNSGYALVTMDSSDSALLAWRILHKKPICSKRFVEVFALLPPFCPICRRGQQQQQQRQQMDESGGSSTPGAGEPLPPTHCVFCCAPLSAHADGGLASIATFRMRRAVLDPKLAPFAPEFAGLMHTGFLKLPALIYQDASVVTRQEIEIFNPDRWRRTDSGLSSNSPGGTPHHYHPEPERLYSLRAIEAFCNDSPENQVSDDYMTNSSECPTFFNIMDIANYDCRTLLCEIVDILTSKVSTLIAAQVSDDSPFELNLDNHSGMAGGGGRLVPRTDDFNSWKLTDEGYLLRRRNCLVIAELGNWLSTRARAYLFVTEIKLRNVLEAFDDFFEISKDVETALTTVSLKDGAIPKGVINIMEMDSFQLTRRRKAAGYSQKNGPGSPIEKPVGGNRLVSLMRSGRCVSSTTDYVPRTTRNDSIAQLPSTYNGLSTNNRNIASDKLPKINAPKRHDPFLLTGANGTNRTNRTKNGQRQSLIQDEEPSQTLNVKTNNRLDPNGRLLLGRGQSEQTYRDNSYPTIPMDEKMFYDNSSAWYGSTGPLEVTNLEANELTRRPQQQQQQQQTQTHFKNDRRLNRNYQLADSGSFADSSSSMLDSSDNTDVIELRRHWSARAAMGHGGDTRSTAVAMSPAEWGYVKTSVPSTAIPPPLKLSRAITEDPAIALRHSQGPFAKDDTTESNSPPWSSAIVADFLRRVSDQLLVAEYEARKRRLKVPGENDYPPTTENRYRNKFPMFRGGVDPSGYGDDGNMRMNNPNAVIIPPGLLRGGFGGGECAAISPSTGSSGRSIGLTTASTPEFDIVGNTTTKSVRRARFLSAEGCESAGLILPNNIRPAYTGGVADLVRAYRRDGAQRSQLDKMRMVKEVYKLNDEHDKDDNDSMLNTSAPLGVFANDLDTTSISRHSNPVSTAFSTLYGDDLNLSMGGCGGSQQQQQHYISNGSLANTTSRHTARQYKPDPALLLGSSSSSGAKTSRMSRGKYMMGPPSLGSIRAGDQDVLLPASMMDELQMDSHGHLNEHSVINGHQHRSMGSKGASSCLSSSGVAGAPRGLGWDGVANLLESITDRAELMKE